MPLFDLSPVADHRGHPDWAASSHRNPCYVSARDERRARIYAANTFFVADVPRSDGGLRPASPWTCPTMVRVGPLFWRGVGVMSEGTIFVPADPDKTQDDLLVLRKIR